MGQVSQEPQKLQKAVKGEISNDFFNTAEDKKGLAEIFPSAYKHYLSTFYRTTLEAIPNVRTGQLSLNLQGLVNSISNNPKLTSQQKQQALNDVNNNLTDLQNIKNDIDAQEWLDRNYPKESRKRIKELDIGLKNLTGELDLSDFERLKELLCSNNNLTNCNFLNTLPNPEKLTILDLSNNDITQDLAVFSRFSSLERL
ncbi:hypothetical protein C1645_744905 [Glomus cerebriforme]|uniref:Uncharacterized protein n=1 Tax=Glomus cerebriforme TaxID=658196 RepID=A0A397S9D4_9GLOM|nr:hypothetical protein C1645_744905 [Glomus cerebriforme]